MNKEKKTTEQSAKYVRAARAVIKNLPPEGYIALSDVDQIITSMAGEITNPRTFQSLRRKALRYANQYLGATYNHRILNVAEKGEVIYHRTTTEKALRIEERIKHNRAKAKEQARLTFFDVTESHTLGEVDLEIQKPSIWNGQFDKFEHSLIQGEEVAIEIS